MPRLSLIQVRRGTASEWTAANPILALGEPGFETNTKKLKLGDGVTAWNSLAYIVGGAGSAVWGAIAGTLSDQTDLQTALDAKVTGPGSATNNHVALFDGSTGKLLKDGGAVPTGDVVGPGSATADDIAIYNGSTGKIIKDSGKKVTDFLASGDSAGGDLTGTFPNPTVGANKISYAKMQAASAASILLGRESGSAGNLEEIALGSGLSMSGTTLNASGGPSGVLIQCFRNVLDAAYVTVPSNAAFNIASPSKFTIEIAFRASSLNTNAGLCTRSSLLNDQGDWALGFFDGSHQRLTWRLNGYPAGGGAQLQSATDIPLDGAWHIIQANYDSTLGSNNMKIFLNGILDCQASYSTVITNTATQIAAGCYFNPGSAIQGFLSYFRFSNGVVRNTANYTPVAILAPDADTTLLWSFVESKIGVDTSGNGFNGTFFGNNVDVGIRGLS